MFYEIVVDRMRLLYYKVKASFRKIVPTINYFKIILIQLVQRKESDIREALDTNDLRYKLKSFLLPKDEMMFFLKGMLKHLICNNLAGNPYKCAKL